jgi:Lipocalin-like domain
MGPKCKIALAMIACGLLGAAAVPVGAQQSAASERPIVGIWKLVSFLPIVDGEPPRDALGNNPKGYLIVTREGRMMAILTSSSRKAGTRGRNLSMPEDAWIAIADR